MGAVRRRRAKKQVQDAAAADIKTLELRAGKLLVGLDDALKTSEQELGFAQAQFGDDQIRDFRAALTDAKATAKQAFEIQHKLEDPFPETPEQYRAMTLQLIELAERADATLDAQADSFEKLRRLDRNAPQVLDEIAKEQEGLADRIDAAENTLAGLVAQYPKADLDHLTGVPAQARKLTGFAAHRGREGPRRTGEAQGRRRRRGPGGAAGRRPGRPAAREHRYSRRRPRDARRAAQAERGGTRPAAAAGTLAGLRRPGLHHHASGCGRRERAHPHLRGGSAPGGRRRLAASDPANAMDEAREATSSPSPRSSRHATTSPSYERTATAQEYPDEPAYQEVESAGLGGILNDLFFGGGSGGV